MIILASSSPRRRELLSMIGLNYVIETSGEEEMQPHGLPPAEFVKTLGRCPPGITGEQRHCCLKGWDDNRHEASRYPAIRSNANPALTESPG